MEWPKSCRKRISYVLVAPILVPLWLTLPDTRTPRGKLKLKNLAQPTSYIPFIVFRCFYFFFVGKKLFPITFLGSICWIAAYSYLMVWWANVIGDTAEIPPEVCTFSLSVFWLLYFSTNLFVRIFHICCVYETYTNRRHRCNLL